MRARMQTGTLGDWKGRLLWFSTLGHDVLVTSCRPSAVCRTRRQGGKSHVYTIGREIQMRCDLVVVRPCLGHAICRPGAAVEGGT